MAMSAVLTVVGNAITNQPSTCTLVVTNSGASNVNVTGVQPKIVSSLGPSVPVVFSPVFAPPGVSVSTTNSINQLAVTVAAGGTATFTFQVVAMAGSVQTGQPTQGAASYQISADVISDDGSVFSPVAQNFNLAYPQLGQPGSSPNISPVGRGELQFNLQSNAVFGL